MTGLANRKRGHTANPSGTAFAGRTRTCTLVSALFDHGTPEDRETLEARAVGYLRRAIEADPDRLLPQVPAERDLDPLRRRADFCDLMADASFPRDPFVAPSPRSGPR
jgi:hypothetical protein